MLKTRCWWSGVIALSLFAAACSESDDESSVAGTATSAEPTIPPTSSTSVATTEVEAGATTTSLSEVDDELVGQLGGDSDLFPDSGNGGDQVEVWDWDLTISDDLTGIAGSVDATAVAERDLRRFSFDARDLAIESVLVDGVQADFALVGPELVITVSETIDKGATFVVEIDYTTTPSPYSPPGVPFRMGWDVDEGSQVLAHGFTGAQATWVPSNETVDDARYVMSVTVPDGFVARAAGHLESTTENDGTQTFVWDTRREVSFATLAIAEYETHVIDTAGFPIEVALPAGSETGRIDTLSEELPEMVEFLEQLYGPFPFDRLNISAMTNRPFAFAGPMHILIEPTMPTWLLVHEISHQWLGNSVGQETDESGWLFEGAATYTANVLWPEFRSGTDPSRLAVVLDRDVPSSTRPLDELNEVADLLDSATYQRGALLYHALRVEIGDDAFFATLAAFTDQHAHSTATPEDLQAVAETAAGRELGDFFNAWISQSAVPDYDTNP